MIVVLSGVWCAVFVDRGDHCLAGYSHRRSHHRIVAVVAVVPVAVPARSRFPLSVVSGRIHRWLCRRRGSTGDGLGALLYSASGPGPQVGGTLPGRCKSACVVLPFQALLRLLCRAVWNTASELCCAVFIRCHELFFDGDRRLCVS